MAKMDKPVEISSTPFTHTFQKKGQIVCSIEGGNVFVTISAVNEPEEERKKKTKKLTHGSVGGALAIEDEKKDDRAPEWTVTITRDPAIKKDAVVKVHLTAPLT